MRDTDGCLLVALHVRVLFRYTFFSKLILSSYIKNRLRPAPRRSEVLILSFLYVVDSVSIKGKTKFFLGVEGFLR